MKNDAIILGSVKAFFYKTVGVMATKDGSKKFC